VGTATTLVVAEATDVGRRRSNNQDSHAILAADGPQAFRNTGWLLLVADGMGAHAAGELASAMAAKIVPERYAGEAQPSPPLALGRSMRQANSEIHARGERDTEHRGMGTTCSVLVLLSRGAIIGHVGDSRVYRIRSSTIEQLSRDHSLKWEIEANSGPHDQGIASIPKNIITRSMGPHEQVEIDLEGPFPIEEGDVFVLCSDGLSGQAIDEEIGMFAGSLPPEQAAAALIGLSLVRGAPDNTTVIVARAGRSEVSRYSSRDQPWPLKESRRGERRITRRPTVLLAIAAVCLFAALLVYPTSSLGQMLDRTTALVGSLFMLALSFGMLAGAIAGFLTPVDRHAKVLAPGKQLGKAPYRSYRCDLAEDRIATLLRDIDSGITVLSEMDRSEDRSRLQTLVDRGRQQLATGALSDGLATTGEALAGFWRCFEAARAEVTLRHPSAEASVMDET
jgi:serine/threonine protein phosphatase PrpC